MEVQHKGFERENNFVSKTEQSELLCCNKDSCDCSVLEYMDTTTQEQLLVDQFASIIVEMFLEAEGIRPDAKERNNVLPGINQRAG
jgi:hypothetical protein